MVAYEGIRRLLSGETLVETSAVAFAVLIAAIIVDAWRWYSLTKAAATPAARRSPPMRCTFFFRSWNSALVIVALIAAHFGYPQLDPLVAVGVALFIAVTGWRLGRPRLIPDGCGTERHGGKNFGAITEVPGVVRVDALRCGPRAARCWAIFPFSSRASTRWSGSRKSRERWSAQQKRCGGSACDRTATPIAMDDESILERILLIAAHKRVPIHHVTVQHIGERLSVSFDVEVDGRLSMGAAHRKASQMEEAIRAEFGQ